MHNSAMLEDFGIPPVEIVVPGTSNGIGSNELIVFLTPDKTGTEGISFTTGFPTDESVQMTFYSGFADFEDGLINSLAEWHHMDAILTNNIADFANSSVPVYRPSDFVSLFLS